MQNILWTSSKKNGESIILKTSVTINKLHLSQFHHNYDVKLFCETFTLTPWVKGKRYYYFS